MTSITANFEQISHIVDREQATAGREGDLAMHNAQTLCTFLEDFSKKWLISQAVQTFKGVLGWSDEEY